MLEFCQELSVTEYRIDFLIAAKGRESFQGRGNGYLFFFFFKKFSQGNKIESECNKTYLTAVHEGKKEGVS